MSTRRGRSHSPWYGNDQVPTRVQVTARELLPSGSWWVDAPDFYEEAKKQLPRLLETAGRGPLKGQRDAEAAA